MGCAFVIEGVKGPGPFSQHLSDREKERRYDSCSLGLSIAGVWILEGSSWERISWGERASFRRNIMDLVAHYTTLYTVRGIGVGA